MQQMNYGLQILKTDIIPLTNCSWPGSFGNIEGNKKVLAERGWYPFNCNLLLNDKIRVTMTKQQLQDKEELGLFPTETRDEWHFQFVSLHNNDDDNGILKQRTIEFRL